MKWIKRLVLAVVLLVAFIVIALFGIAMLVDPNDYRDEIAAAVKQQTGRELVMEGDLDLSVFPWLGLELNRVRLNNPPGFTDEVFAAVERVNIKVALWPLLRLETRVGNLELDGLTVNLERRADGTTNWEGLGPAAEAGAPAAPAQPDAPPEDKPAVPVFYVGSLDITNTNISWRDAVGKVYTRIENMHFTTGEILPLKSIPFTLELSVRNDAPKLLAGVHLDGSAQMDLAAEIYTLENLKLDLQADGSIVPGRSQTLQLQLPKLTAALKEQKITVEQLKLQAAGLSTTVGLDLQLESYEKSPLLSGQLSAQVAQLRGLMEAFGIEPPVTADPNVLGAFQAEFAFKHDDKSVALQNLKLKFDDTTMTGSLTMSNFAAPAYRMSLVADTLNADRYLPPPEPAPAPGKETETGSPGSDQVVLPVEELRALRAEGSLKFGELQAMKLKLANLTAGLSSAGDGIVKLDPLSVDLYGGNFKGAVILDVTRDTPVYKVSADLAQVQIEPLLTDYMDSDYMSGKMNGKLEITTTGNRFRALKKNLNGTAALSFRDGALSGDIREKAREWAAKIKREPYNAPPKKPTTFSAIRAGLDIEQGVVRNKDLEVRAGTLYITGEGEYSLVSDMIDYTPTLLFTKDPTGQDQALKEFYDIPIKPHLKGKLAKLDYADIMTDALKAVAKAKAKAEVKEKKEEAKEKAKDELKDKLKEKFKLKF
jgi:AsmA protein